jgi:hypothetical protein
VFSFLVCCLAILMCDVLIELDMEYRYWSFMEAHPMHTLLPVNAKIEAMDVLTWAWTGTKNYLC